MYSLIVDYNLNMVMSYDSLAVFQSVLQSIANFGVDVDTVSLDYRAATILPYSDTCPATPISYIYRISCGPGPADLLA